MRVDAEHGTVSWPIGADLDLTCSIPCHNNRETDRVETPGDQLKERQNTCVRGPMSRAPSGRNSTEDIA